VTGYVQRANAVTHIAPTANAQRGSANIAEAVMVEAVPESIPTNLRDAFHFAVLSTPRHWSGEDPDPEIISLDLKPFTPSAICGLVTKYADPMPQYIYDVLRELGYAEGTFRMRPPLDSSSA
jgi:hypothetical protein